MRCNKNISYDDKVIIHLNDYYGRKISMVEYNDYLGTFSLRGDYRQYDYYECKSEEDFD